MNERGSNELISAYHQMTGSLIQAHREGLVLPDGWGSPEETPWMDLPYDSNHPGEARVYRYSQAALISYQGLSRAIVGQGTAAQFVRIPIQVDPHKLPPDERFGHFEQYIYMALATGEKAAIDAVGLDVRESYESLYLDTTHIDPSVQLTKVIVMPRPMVGWSEGPSEGKFFAEAAVVGLAKQLQVSRNLDFTRNDFKYRIVPAAMRRRGNSSVPDLRAMHSVGVDTDGNKIKLDPDQYLMDPAEAVLYQDYSTELPRLLIGDYDLGRVSDEHPWIQRYPRPYPILSCVTMGFRLGPNKGVNAFSSFCYATMNLADRWGLFQSDFAEAYLKSLGG